MQVYRFVSSALYRKFLRLPEFDFCFAKITRNHGAFLRFADFLWSANGHVPFYSYADLRYEQILRIKRHIISTESVLWLSKRMERVDIFLFWLKSLAAFFALIYKHAPSPINPARIFSSFCLFFFKQEKEGQTRKMEFFI